jgi:dephospho-CoA kinase
VELDAFRDRFGDDFVLVSIEAPFEVRRERIEERGRDDPDSETLEERDERELGFGMGDAMERADVRIENTDSLERFREQITALLEEGETAVDA